MTEELAQLWRVMALDLVPGPAGAVSVLEPMPWTDVRRIYLCHLDTAGTVGGRHAHRSLRQILIAVGGSISVTLRTPTSEVTHLLRPQREALVLEPGLWREYAATEGSATLMVAASKEYHEEDYLRGWQEYCDWFRTIGE
jgi:hypothetical protein